MASYKQLLFGSLISGLICALLIRPSSAIDEDAPTFNERFSMLPFGESIVLLDAVTGKTWLLSTEDLPHPTWKQIPIASSTVNTTDKDLFPDVNIPFVEEIGGPVLIKPKK